MEERKMRLSYDKIADVLYISFGKPSFGIDHESEPGIFIRHNPERKEIIGATIIDFEKRFSKKIEETIPISLEEIYI